MKIKNTPLIAAFLMLAACGQSHDGAAHTDHEADKSQDQTHGEIHAGHADTAGAVGYGRGVIRAVGPEKDFLTIAHGPLEGIEMGAMTMGFDILAGVDLSGFSDGDEVAFAVKRGRDNSFRISAICNTATEGEDCLDALRK